MGQLVEVSDNKLRMPVLHMAGYQPCDVRRAGWLGVLLCLVLLSASCAKPPAATHEETSMPVEEAAIFENPAAPQAAEQSSQPSSPRDDQAGPGGVSLSAFLAARHTGAQPSLLALFTPPVAGVAMPFHMILAMEPSKTALATEVTAFAREHESLAVAQKGGRLSVISSWPCQALQLPGGQEASALALAPEAGRLAALAAGNRTLHAYDLDACGLVGTQRSTAPITHVAIAPSGSMIAYADAAYGLWAAPALLPAGQNATSLARLRYIAMDVAFSPRGELLVVADQAGWVTVWHPREGTRLKTWRLSESPLAAASIQGTKVLARTVSGEALMLQLATGTVHSGPLGPPEALTLRDGVLEHQGDDTSLVRRMALGIAPIRAWFEAASRVLTIQDVDGAARSYTPEGRATQPSTSRGAPLQVGEHYDITLENGPASLAFPLYTAANQTLYLRQLEKGQRYLVWWQPGEHPEAPTTPPAGLPLLEHAFSSSTQAWLPLE